MICPTPPPSGTPIPAVPLLHLPLLPPPWPSPPSRCNGKASNPRAGCTSHLTPSTTRHTYLQTLPPTRPARHPSRLTARRLDLTLPASRLLAGSIPPHVQWCQCRSSPSRSGRLRLSASSYVCNNNISNPDGFQRKSEHLLFAPKTDRFLGPRISRIRSSLGSPSWPLCRLVPPTYIPRPMYRGLFNSHCLQSSDARPLVCSMLAGTPLLSLRSLISLLESSGCVFA